MRISALLCCVTLAAGCTPGTELYFHSNRPGGYGGNDLYRSTRTKLKEPDEDNK